MKDSIVYCSNCNVPTHLHGTHCGWLNASCILHPLTEQEQAWKKQWDEAHRQLGYTQVEVLASLVVDACKKQNNIAHKQMGSAITSLHVNNIEYQPLPAWQYIEKDELPPEGTYVLCVCYRGLSHVMRTYKTERDELKWMDKCGNYQKEHIVKWQPLPK